MHLRDGCILISARMKRPKSGAIKNRIPTRWRPRACWRPRPIDREARRLTVIVPDAIDVTLTTKNRLAKKSV
jgi:hypothetical protein